MRIISPLPTNAPPTAPRSACRLAACLVLVLAAPILGQAQSPDRATGLELFEKRVRPVLVERCYNCHSAQSEKLKGGLHVDSRAGLLKGGDTRAAIVPGDPEKSLLIEAVRRTNPDLQMPPKGKLSQEQVEDLMAWVRIGAPWPGDEAAAPLAKKPAFDLEGRRRSHWAWQPIREVTPPQPRNGRWARGPVDQFILARLEQAALSPAAEAEPRTLARRLYFDLTGLPPSPEEVHAYLEDRDPQAYEHLVERLLASPQFGERWARHWLDLVRYAETLGHEFDYPRHNAWRYRDYVIRALNQDVPYDQFLTEHIAGDLMNQPRRNAKDGSDESVIGTAFFWLGQQAHSPVDVGQHQADLIDNQIDVLSKTFLGLTVACARCHDHKFDAISTKDFYALYGVLASSRCTQHPINNPRITGDTRQKMQALKTELRPLLAEFWAGQSNSFRSSAATVAKITGARSHNLKQGAFADFTRGAPEGWFVEGDAFRGTRAKRGDLLLSAARETVEGVETEPCLDTALFSKRLQGVLRSPTFTITNQFIHIRAAGHATRINLVIRNFTLIRDPIYGGLRRTVNSQDPIWLTIDAGRWRGEHAYLEFSDTSIGDPADDGAYASSAETGHMAVYQVLFSDQSPPVAEAPSPGWQPGGSDPPHVGSEAFAGEFEQACVQAVRSWGAMGGKETGPSEEQIRLLDTLIRAGILKLPTSPSGKMAGLLKDYRQAEESIHDPIFAPAMADGNGVDEPVLIRGNPHQPGDIVQRRFLEALGGRSLGPPENGSGREELARCLTDPANPLVARVMANRIWLHLFGRGIVPTPDDFGVLGQLPTHPELLDWLAHHFMTEDKWSIKRLIRELVTSSTYRMSSRPESQGAERSDPENGLWHRMPVRRLEGETIRDSILAVSGSLDTVLFGPSIPTYLTDFMDGRGRPSNSGPLDGAGRRSIYLEVRNNFLSPMMRTFDAPVPFTTVGRRTVSNVPAQALILLNDPLVIDQARHWAERLLAGRADPEDLIRSAYQAAFARPATEREIRQARSFLEIQRAAYGLTHEQGCRDLRVWTDFCHVLMNTKEFIYLN